KVSADLRYALTPRFGFIGTVGYENYDYLFIGEKPEGNFWSGGIFWQPSNLTSLTFSVGERFYGRTKALDFSHQSRWFLWSAHYSEDITSARENFLVPNFNAAALNDSPLLKQRYPDDLERARLINEFITLTGTNFITNRIFLEKRFDASVAF